MIRGPKKTVAVLMPMELYEALKNHAQASSRTIPAYVRQVLKRYFRYLEERKDGLDDRWVI